MKIWWDEVGRRGCSSRVLMLLQGRSMAKSTPSMRRRVVISSLEMHRLAAVLRHVEALEAYAQV